MAGVAELKFDVNSGVEVVISGKWLLREKNTTAEECIGEILRKDRIKKVVLKSKNLTSWDSSLVNFLAKILKVCEERQFATNVDGIPVGARRLVDLSKSYDNGKPVVEQKKRRTIREFWGAAWCLFIAKLQNFVDFLGELCIGISAFFSGRAHIREQEFAVILQDAGAKAFPIVALISFLVGLIIAFISILQLAQFGASIYVADLVGIAMMREMGCIMTGVIMSGRTGAAFAATIGTMIVNDEVDALRTTGFSSVNFLVLPRIFALTLMMPLLCTFSSFIGIFGGLCASTFVTDLTVSQYYAQTVGAVSIGDFFVGVSKGMIFGVLIAAIGCMKGLQCGRSSEDVGLAATSAVVTSITAIIVADAIFAVIFSSIGI
ncbi:MAG: ABC transporter permease [Puniceicoccales bacterium]|jgi:phospholipid/cholesterol/gamma-HCH transport system permease protein|nr:ABC transporter permease [Puniceicoccales bacterium]